MVLSVNSGFTPPPVSSALQPSGTNAQSGTTAQVPKQNTPQPAQAATASSQKSQDQNLSAPKEDKQTPLTVANEAPHAPNPSDIAAEAPPRGSVLDIEV